VSESKHEATAAEKAGKGGSSLESRAAILFGLIGLITGVVGLVFSYQAQHEQQVINFAASPSAGLSDLTPQGLGVRLNVVNQSLRPVIVRGASLWDGPTRLALATGYFSDVRVLNSAEVDPSQLTTRLTNLPLNVGAREGHSMGLLLDVWSGVSESKGTAAQAARGRLNATLNGLGSVSTRGESLTLQLDLAPGGRRRFLVRSPDPWTAEAAADLAPKWVVSPLGSPPKLIGLLLRNRSAGVREVDLVRLDLWKTASTLHRTMTRPVLGQQAASFPLVGLPRGSYATAFELDGRVIANRSFSLPWRGEPCAVGPQEAGASELTSAAAWC
jgi:hypothetical protein